MLKGALLNVQAQMEMIQGVGKNKGKILTVLAQTMSGFDY